MSEARFPTYVRQANRQIADNYHYLQAHLDPAFAVLPIDGSCFCLIDVSRLGMDDVAYAHLLMEHYGVIVIPMTYFYTERSTPATQVRVSLARSEAAVRRLVELLNASAADAAR